MTGLRTIWGVSFDKINDDFKEMLLKSSKKFIDEGLLEIVVDSNGEKKLKTTKKGKFLADGLASELFLI